MSDAEIRATAETAEAINSADYALKLQMLAYARGLTDGKRLAQNEAAKETAEQ